jgi:hypothetical protein
MAEKIVVGQTFKADDGGIELTVVQVGSRNEMARFRVTNLNKEKASYTIIVHRRSAEPDRINYKTDDPPKNNGEYELSADETTGIEIRHEQR